MSFTCTAKFHIDTIYRSKQDIMWMMILVNCGCCGVASGYGCAMWCTHGATGVQQQEGGGTVLLYEGSERRADGERLTTVVFVLFSLLLAVVFYLLRSSSCCLESDDDRCLSQEHRGGGCVVLVGVCIAKISPKKLGDYNCLITGI